MRREVIFTVPTPPSVNECYANNKRTGGRYKTKKYIAWMESSAKGFGTSLADLRIGVFTKPVMALFSVGKPGDKIKRDCHNYSKPICDFLQKIECVKDDSLIHDMRIKWDEDIDFGTVEVRITEI